MGNFVIIPLCVVRVNVDDNVSPSPLPPVYPPPCRKITGADLALGLYFFVFLLFFLSNHGRSWERFVAEPVV